MPGALTDVTELATALGTLAPEMRSAVAARPLELVNVPDDVWERLVDAYRSGDHAASFQSAFHNGAAFLGAQHGLRGRRPMIVEWKGPHRPPGDDAVPADLRIDHVYLVSCKYLSRVLLNAGPSRLFDRLLVGEDRDPLNWFSACAPIEFQSYYDAAKARTTIPGLPSTPRELSKAQQLSLCAALSGRTLPEPLRPAWCDLCRVVSEAAANRWRSALTSDRLKLRLLWRLLRISGVSYFVLGTDHATHLRLRVASAWDWNQAFALSTFAVAARDRGQPEVSWTATVRDRATGELREVEGHVEVRWSHGRFVGSPEAKVYLDTPHALVPGYYELN